MQISEIRIRKVAAEGKLKAYVTVTFDGCFVIHNVKIMSYYLLQNENNIGHNYRNNFAHYKNIKTKDMNLGKVLKITQIFLCIINELLVKIK